MCIIEYIRQVNLFYVGDEGFFGQGVRFVYYSIVIIWFLGGRVDVNVGFVKVQGGSFYCIRYIFV